MTSFVWHVCTNVSEEPDDDIFMVEDCRHLEDSCSAYFSEKLVLVYQTTRCHIPTYFNLTVVTARTSKSQEMSVLFTAAEIATKRGRWCVVKMMEENWDGK